MRERLYPKFRYVAPWLIAAFGTLLACSRQPGDEKAGQVAAVMGLRGTALAEPLAKPAFVLSRSDGSAYDFARETSGKVALLFFGYTHCPDVCPLHMANIAAVLKKMPWEDREAIEVVFVTTDPERDTAARLNDWLAGFDPSFVGLRGPIDDVNEIQQSLGLAPATRQASAVDSGEGYLVGHAAQVIAFGRDDVARVVYPFSTRQDDWAHDLPILVGGRGGAVQSVASPAAESTPQPSVSILEMAIGPAVVAAAPDGLSGVLYLTILNPSDRADTLRALSVIGGGAATLHVTATNSGSATMQNVPWLEIPPRSLFQMQPGGAHVMVQAASQPLVAGHAAVVELHLARTGRVTIPATVVTYAQLDSVLALARSSFDAR